MIDVLALRAVPAAAVYLALTRRCPLTCAHCSTNSMFDSEEHPADLFTRFVGSFTADDRPEFIIMSGGEPLLRPHLVRQLAESARAVGARSFVLSGMFFARGRDIPRSIRRAIEAVDHVSASIDVFHEREVSRAEVFRVLGQLHEEGKDVSLHVVGLDRDDPYLAALTDDIRRTFDDRVPVLVTHVGPSGRAVTWLERDVAGGAGSAARPDPDPCALATWPVVSFDGSIVACCNQDVVDGPAPQHLRLGHAGRDGWAVVRDRLVASAMMRAIRLFGPEYLADRYGSMACDGYCSTCCRLTSDPVLERHLEPLMGRASTRALEEQVLGLHRRAGAIAYARRFGIARYADLVALGAPTAEAACAS